MFPQTGIETQLVGAGPLRVEVANRIVRLGGPNLVCGIVFVGRDGQMPREGHTHRGNRTANLQIGQRTTHVPERGRHPRKAHRRVEERRFGRFGQLRGPVVATRHREVEHLLPPHLHRGEEGLRLLLPARLLGPLLRIIEVENVEDIRKAVLLNRAPIRQQVGLYVVNRRTDVGLQRPVVTERLVDIHHHVGIGLRIVFALFGVVAVFAAVRNGRVRRSVELLRVERIGIVNPDAPGDIQPRKDVVRGRKGEQVALLVRIAQVAVGNPVGVLHPEVTALEVRRPELLHQFRSRIVTLEDSVGVEIRSPREEVDRDQRVRIDTLVGHVLVLLVDVARRSVQPQLVLQKIAGIAEGEVVTVVGIVGNDTVGIDRCGRKVGLVAVRTAREREGVRIDMARLEEIIGCITGLRSRSKPLSPAVDGRPRARTVQPGSIAVLELRQHEGIQKLRVARERHLQGAGLSLFRRNHHRTIRCIRTVQSRCRSARQHRNRLDILRVQVGNRLRGTLRIELRTASATEVVHRNTVDDIQGIRRLRDGLVTAQHHLRGTAHARRRGVDRHTGHLARERIHEVGILHGGDIFGPDLLDIVRKGLLFAFDAQGRHHNRLDLRGRFPERHRERRPRTDRHRSRLIAQIAHLEGLRGGRSGNLQREAPLGVRRDAQRGAPHDHRGADDRLSIGIGHATGDRHRPCRCGLLFINEDAASVDIVTDVERSEQLIQDFGD